MSIKNDVWLMQRLEKPTGYVNPYGDVNREVKERSITEVVSPDYMGAAEYEWGAYGKCIDTMYKWGVFKKTIHIYPKTDNTRFGHLPVNIVYCNGAEIDHIIEQVRYLYLEVSRIYHETGAFPEISKNDRGSFYRDMQDSENSKYIGWLNIKEHYAIFLNGDRTKHFMDHINSIHDQRAKYYDQITTEGVIHRLKQINAKYKEAK